jgi:acyl-CoA thioester hydrolase
VVNEYLIAAGALDIQASAVVGLVVETKCNYFSELAFPQRVDAGLRVAHAGRSSVRYELALFSADSDTASAQGHFIHVYVDRSSRRPSPLPAALRAAIEQLLI